MEYRARWLDHAGLMSRHLEVVLHAFDRETPSGPIRLLDVGIENGGSLEIWRELLPEGSTVTGIDNNPACAELGLPVLIGDITNRKWVRETFQGQWFDVIIDSTGTMTGNLWPYLPRGGRLFIETFDNDRMTELLAALLYGEDSWLPTEEILRIAVYQGVVCIEKSSPRIVPFLEVVSGNFAEVLSENDMREMGIRQVVV